MNEITASIVAIATRSSMNEYLMWAVDMKMCLRWGGRGISCLFNYLVLVLVLYCTYSRNLLWIMLLRRKTLNDVRTLHPLSHAHCGRARGAIYFWVTCKIWNSTFLRQTNVMKFFYDPTPNSWRSTHLFSVCKWTNALFLLSWECTMDSLLLMQRNFWWEQ
jgi:hypothetical protein